MNKSSLLLLCLMCGMFSGCAAHIAPELSFYDEKTALENQILGSYRELEEDVWMVASVRSTEDEIKKVEMPTSKRKVLDAINNQKFNADDVLQLKKEQAAGENSSGYLVFFENERTGKDPEYRKFAEEIIGRENEYRKIIMEELAESGNSKIEEVEKAFAKMRAEESPKGTRIQSEDGKWSAK